MITTGAGSTWPSDVEIGDRSAAGLLHKCFVRWKAFTLPNEAILQRIGRLSEPDLAAIRDTARKWLAPSPAAVPN
jgi:mRNA interferase MazF